MRWRFGDYVLDTGQVVLRGPDGTVHLEPQAFAVLRHLLESRDRVVAKEELLDEIWGDRFVSESALTSRVKSVRRAVGDDGSRQEVIRTVHGLGYQFVADVEPETAAVVAGGRPTGTVTFLFTDIEGSTRRWERAPDAMARSVERHDLVVRRAIGAAGGYVFSTTGDGFAAAFATPAGALAAATGAQADLARERWPGEEDLRVRMGVHTGVAEERDGDYFGPVVNETARIAAAGHGGQILLSDTTVRLVGRDGLRDLSVRRLPDVGEPMRLWQVGPERFAELRATRAEGTGIPVPLGSLLGREPDLGRLADRLRGEQRLVTLVGPGGVGKTRLATEVARSLVGHYDGGVYFVGLADLADPAAVAGRIAETFDLSGDGDEAIDAVAGRIGATPTLLIVDNFEQVLAGAIVVARLLGAASGATVLVTSRERLGLAGELLHPVEPLDTSPSGPAAALFARAASGADHGFTIDVGNAVDVSAICRALDGLPLAIELAAAQVRVLGARGLRQRLEEGVAEVGDTRRDLPARQATMTATIQWSYDLLTEQERVLIESIAVFDTPASLEDIEEVAGPDVDGDLVAVIGALFDKNLLRRVEDDDGPRFGLLVLIREFARARLAESGREPDVRSRHAACQAAFVRAVEQSRWRGDLDRWIRRVNGRWPEIRRALEWSFSDGDPTVGARIFGDAHSVWQREGRLDEGQHWAERSFAVLDRLPADARGRVHMARGYLAFGRRDQDAARQDWTAVLDVVGAGTMEHALAAINLAGAEIGAAGDYDLGIELARAGIGEARASGADALVAHGLNVLGEIHRAAGNDDAAEAAYLEAATHARRAGDIGQLSIITANRLYTAEHRGDHEQALALGREALRMCWDAGSRRSMAAWSVGEIAGPELGRGRADRAARLLGAADAAFERIAGTRGPADQPEYERVLAATEAELGPERHRALRAEGGALTLADAVRYALGDSDPFDDGG